MANVDSRVYYYWTKLQNNSDLVEYGNAPTQPLPSGLGCGSHRRATAIRPCRRQLRQRALRLHEEQRRLRRLVALRRAASGSASATTTWTSTRTASTTAGRTTNKFFVEYKNTMLDKFTGRLKYQYLKRDADINFSNVGVEPQQPELPASVHVGVRHAGRSTTNQIKLNLDWTPTPLLALSFEGNWIKQNFDDVTYGRTNNDRQGYYLSANWGDPNKFMINGFGNWEETKYPSSHRYIGTVARRSDAAVRMVHGGACATRTRTASARSQLLRSGRLDALTGSYNWNSQTKDQTWMLGVGMDWPVNPQWMLKASYIYVENDGEATFSSREQLRATRSTSATSTTRSSSTST